MKLISMGARAASLSLLVSACAPTPAPVSPTQPGPVAEAPPAPVTVPSDDAPPVTVPSDVAPAQGSGAAAQAASKFAAWGAVHALIGSTVKIGKSVSDREAIALTADNLVGVTTDGGKSWGFMRHTNGQVLAIAGKADGPFVAVGKAGYAALSTDGKTWSDLPRYTNEDLVAVAVDAPGIVALGKSGAAFVRYGLDGKSGLLDVFPDKVKAKDVTASNGAFFAAAGKVPYTSLDGTVWAPVQTPTPAAPAAKAFPTSQGMCALGKVDKATGVVCEVKGQAFGLDGATVVAQKPYVFTSTNGGGSWKAATSPLPAPTGVVKAGSNLVAYGAGGVITTSTDGGATWTLVSTELTKAYKTAWVDGQTVILAGDGGAMARSTDGGVSFTTVVTPQTGGFKQVGKLADGRLVASLGAKGIESADGGATWADMGDPAPLAELVPPAKPGKCEARIPAAAEVCAMQKATTSPPALPNARGLTFSGDRGLAYGDYGLVMTSGDGGASWTAQSGFAMKALQAFAVHKSVVVGVSGKDVVLSNDGGVRFSRHLLPKEAGNIYHLHISHGGDTLYAVGANGTIARALVSAPDAWQMLDVGNVAGGGKKVTANFVRLHEVGTTPESGGLLFAVGARGELFRSDNAGDSWQPIATGTAQVIQRIAASADTVVAVTYTDRNGGNLLLKSDDGGRHFTIAREVSHQGSVDVLTLEGTTLTYRDRVSNDFGATWSKDPDSRYWSDAEDVQDGSGLRIVNHDSRYMRDTIYLVGPAKDDWVILDGVQTRMARFECAKDSGCWMLHGGQIYRPL